MFSHEAAGQDTQTGAIVIDGGTLIDGNGGAPVGDVQIVIRGNKIVRVGKKGEPSPAGARVIKADGKFILPGLWDAQLNFFSYQGETLLNNGVTSYIGIGNNGETGVFMHDGIVKGKILSPRPFDTPVRFVEAANLNGLESPYQQVRPLKTAEEASEWTRRTLALGADIVPFQTGRAPDDVVRTAFEEAHKAGKSAIIRSGGPEILPKKAADLGADIIPHSLGVAIEIAGSDMPAPPPAPEEGEAGGNPAGEPDELEFWAHMDEAKAAAEIKYLVDRHVYLVPTFIQKAMGLPAGWDRFEMEDRTMLGNEALRAYYPPEDVSLPLINYVNPVHLRPRNREMHAKGYKNALRFHKMYVEAGGHLLTGTDGANNSAPGSGVHHEMEILAEAGLTPMQVIQATTKWTAEATKAANQLGTIQEGKLADMLIVNADPLQDIQNLKRISNVIFNGKVLDGKYHPWYNASNPFATRAQVAGLAPVEDLNFVLIAKKAVFRGGRGGGGGPSRLPQPEIERIDTQRHDFDDPAVAQVSVREGSPTLHLKMQGFNFFDRTQVFFDGRPIPFELKNITEIDAIIDETLLRRPGRFAMQVKNPPSSANLNWGNGTSNTAWLLVSYEDSLPKK